MWFRRLGKAHKRGPKFKPFDESQLPTKSRVPVADATEDGLMLTEYASRMAVKNRFIRKILADKTPWFIEQSHDDARAVLETLAVESDAESEALAALIRKFRDNPGREKDAQGYSFDDIANLEHRREVAIEVAKRLREQSTDEKYLTEIVDSARRDAWKEIAANIEHNLDVEHFPIDEEYERNREDRLRAFIDEDLAALIADFAGSNDHADT
ncbi:MAG: hypothetical protein ABIW32_04950 [Terrimesophilobacter sp.]